jgi:hypothetical protein
MPYQFYKGLKGSPEFDKVNEIAPLLNEANLV